MPKIIEVEGVDGSFKETNTKSINNYLCKLGYKSKRIDFPNYSKQSSVFVRRFLNGKYDIDDIHIITNFYLYDMYDTIMKLKESGEYNELDFIVFDRYIGSNFIYQSARINTNDYTDIVKYVCETEDIAYNKLKLPKEDLCIYLNLKHELSMDIISKRNKLDINEMNADYLKKVNDIGQFISKLRKWEVVNCFYLDRENFVIKDKKSIFNHIEKILHKELLNK